MILNKLKKLELMLLTIRNPRNKQTLIYLQYEI